jgi:hypothetical protein
MANVIVNVREELIDLKDKPAGLYLSIIEQTIENEGGLAQQVAKILAPVIAKTVADTIERTLGYRVELPIEIVVEPDPALVH